MIQANFRLKYKCSDGFETEDQHVARKHETILKLRKWAESRENLQHLDCEELITLIHSDRELLVEILTHHENIDYKECNRDSVLAFADSLTK